MAWSSSALGVVVWAMLAVSTSASARDAVADFRGREASPDAQRTAHWIVQSADHRGLPFAVVDKKNARLYVFDAAGKLQGDSAALLGQTPGDEIAPDVGKNAATGNVPVHERTTPAGRFISQPGRNLQGEPIVWVDYESAFAIHRIRPGAAYAARAARLASPTPADNRMSLGCVIVPVAFYTNVVERVMGHSKSVTYVLPESGSFRDLFNAL